MLYRMSHVAQPQPVNDCRNGPTIAAAGYTGAAAI
jgi:hypothetical protein